MNLTTTQLATALESWAAGVLTINTVEHAPTRLQEVLPLVICEVKGDRRADRDDQLPGIATYQQSYVRARRAELLLMVSPEDSWAATQTLYDYVDLLGAALLEPTLGGRVHTASPYYEASYDPPEVQYADGTTARAATFSLTIGEFTEVN
jgi:hypothetical protein